MTPVFEQLPPLSLYIHIPWCLKKCPYCDFNSHAWSGEIPETAYIDALLADLQQDLPWVQARVLSTIFFGGGTPSLLSAEGVARLLQGIAERVPIAEDAEITLEANPGTFEQEKFAGFRQAGINRLSIGVQSFDPQQLRRLGRVHDAREAYQAIMAAAACGFDNFNIDLMYALEAQTPAGALADLHQALQAKPTHLSWYQLTLEPNTHFYSQPPPLPEEDVILEIETLGRALLKEHGFAHYEVSAFAQTGKASWHNLNYWHFGDYLGIGAGAHGKLTSMTQQQVQRTHKSRQPTTYMAQAGGLARKSEVIEADALAGEFMMNALRLNQGFDAALFAKRTGLTLDTIAPQLLEAQRDGLLLWGETIVPTARGRLFLNDLVGRFI